MRVWGLGSGVWGLGFRVYGLGCGVWDLGFGSGVYGDADKEDDEGDGGLQEREQHP